MSDIRLNRLANVLVNYSTRVKAGEWVHVNANWQAIPLVKEVVAYIDESYASHESMKMALNAKIALENKMGITSNLQPEAFLKTIIKDYNCFCSA
jgi:leucyl aminopeptidase (aminopeptidase T)